MKYLITQEQINTLSASLDALGVVHGLRNLKPVEPMSDAQCDAIMHPLTVNTPYSHRAFARAIERHILGDEA